MAKRLTKTTYKQYEEMLNFVKSNKILLTGKTKPSESRKINNLWNEFAIHVNSIGYGPQKTGEQWRHVFNEWKTNTRRKSRDVQKEIGGTGGGPPVTKKLTDLEEQLLALISKIHLGDVLVSDSLETKRSGSEMLHSTETEACFESVLEDITTDIVVEIDHDYVTAENDIGNEVLQEQSKYENLQLKEENNTPKGTTPKRTGKEKSLHLKENGVTIKKTRNILQEATKNYENAQKISAETEKAKAESISKLADSVNNYSTVFERYSQAKIKLEYYKIFGTLDGFENFY